MNRQKGGRGRGECSIAVGMSRGNFVKLGRGYGFPKEGCAAPTEGVLKPVDVFAERIHGGRG